MKIHYDRLREGWHIESRALAWLVDCIRPRVWLAVFILAYVVCVVGLVLEVAGWLEGWD